MYRLCSTAKASQGKLSKVELSFAYPFLSLAYVAVAVFAYFVFREDLNGYRIAGIAFICVGTVLIAPVTRPESWPPPPDATGEAERSALSRRAHS